MDGLNLNQAFILLSRTSFARTRRINIEKVYPFKYFCVTGDQFFCNISITKTILQKYYLTRNYSVL